MLRRLRHRTLNGDARKLLIPHSESFFSGRSSLLDWSISPYSLSPAVRFLSTDAKGVAVEPEERAVTDEAHKKSQIERIMSKEPTVLFLSGLSLFTAALGTAITGEINLISIIYEYGCDRYHNLDTNYTIGDAITNYKMYALEKENHTSTSPAGNNDVANALSHYKKEDINPYFSTWLTTVTFGAPGAYWTLRTRFENYLQKEHTRHEEERKHLQELKIQTWIATNRLLIAAKYNDREFFHVTSDLRKFDINQESDTDNRDTALHFAARYGNTYLFRRLLESGADLTKLNNCACSPFYEVASCGHEEMLDFIVASFRNMDSIFSEVLDRKTRDGWTPLMAAVRYRHTGTTAKLLAMGAESIEPNDDGETPLMWALINKDLHLIRLLFNHYRALYRQEQKILNNELTQTPSLIFKIGSDVRKISLSLKARDGKLLRSDVTEMSPLVDYTPGEHVSGHIIVEYCNGVEIDLGDYRGVVLRDSSGKLFCYEMHLDPLRSDYLHAFRQPIVLGFFDQDGSYSARLSSFSVYHYVEQKLLKSSLSPEEVLKPDITAISNKKWQLYNQDRDNLGAEGGSEPSGGFGLPNTGRTHYAKTLRLSADDFIEKVIFKRDNNSNNIFHLIARYGTGDILRSVVGALSDFMRDTKQSSRSDEYAAEIRQRIRELLGEKSNISRHGRTPLHEACLEGNLDIVKGFVETPLILGDDDQPEILVNIGATTITGRTALDLLERNVANFAHLSEDDFYRKKYEKIYDYLLPFYTIETAHRTEKLEWAAKREEIKALIDNGSDEGLEQYLADELDERVVKYSEDLLRPAIKTESLRDIFNLRLGIYAARTKDYKTLEKLLDPAETSLRGLRIYDANGMSFPRLVARSNEKVLLDKIYRRMGDVFINFDVQHDGIHVSSSQGHGLDDKYFDIPPMYEACFFSAQKSVEFLLAHKTQYVDTPRVGNLWTPLTLACWGGNYEIAKLLLEHVSEHHDAFALMKFVNHKNISNQTALYMTVMNFCTLRGKQKGRDAYSEAFDRQLMDLLTLLLKYGAYPNEMGGTVRWKSPLHLAMRLGRDDVGRMLIGFGANVNIEAVSSFTPLHYAAFCGHINCVRLLLEFGANSFALSKDGKTSVDLARGPDAIKIEQLLRYTMRFKSENDLDIRLNPDIYEATAFKPEAVGQSAFVMRSRMNDEVDRLERSKDTAEYQLLDVPI